MSMMGTLQGLPTRIHMAEKICRGRQQLEILPRQGTRFVGQRQRPVGIAPRQPLPGLASPCELCILTHRCARLQPAADQFTRFCYQASISMENRDPPLCMVHASGRPGFPLGEDAAGVESPMTQRGTSLAASCSSLSAHPD